MSDWAGTIPEADAIARNFTAAEEKEPWIEEMRRVPGAEFYVKLMEKYMEKGVEQLIKEAQSIRANLDRRTSAPATLDSMKVRYNVYMRFLPRTTPTAAPETDQQSKREDVL
jgi:hypothetical protein